MANGENRTNDGDTDRPDAGTNRIVHPTAGVHTQVRTERDAAGHRHHVYGPGGVDGQTAREHASNPSQPQNWQSLHGADIICPAGTPVYATVDGTIDSGRFGIERGHERDGIDSNHHGNRLTIIGASNSAYYQHLSRFAPGIAPGVTVHAGQLIGYSGIGGGIEHLHIAYQHGDTDRILHEATPVLPSDQPHTNASGGHDGGSTDAGTTSADSNSSARDLGTLTNPDQNTSIHSHEQQNPANIIHTSGNMTDEHSNQTAHSDPFHPAVSGYGADHSDQSVNMTDSQSNMTDAHSGHAVHSDLGHEQIPGTHAPDHSPADANVADEHGNA